MFIELWHLSYIMIFKLSKYLFFFFLFLTICSLFIFFAFVFFTDPKFNRFEDYKRLYNWNLKQYAVGDFDSDGQKDIISYTGCAFLSSVNIKDIPQNQQCTAKGTTVVVYYPDKSEKIGQKYISIKKFNLEPEDTHAENRPISHSYLFTKQNGNWKIFVNSRELAIFEIRKDSLLQKMNSVPIEFKLDEILYFMSVFALLSFILSSFLFSFI